MLHKAVAEATTRGEWQAQSAQVDRFAAVWVPRLRALRHAALDSTVPAGSTPIDVYVEPAQAGVFDTVRGMEPQVGRQMTQGFLATAAALTGWRPQEVLPIYAQLASQGLPMPGGRVSRPFGQLVLAALADIATQPTRYPEMAAAMGLARDGQARELGLATLQGVQGVDHKVDQLLAGQPRAPHRAPWELPPRPTARSFIGRNREVAELITRLRRDEPVTYIVGPAGFGKTALAAEALYDVIGERGSVVGHPYPDGVVFLNVYLLKPQADAIWHALATALVDGDDAALAPDVRVRRACRGKRMLVVVEGAEVADGQRGAANLPDILAILPPETRHLVLTRDERQSLPVHTISLDHPLAPDDAAGLFDQLVQRALPPALRTRVLAKLEGHPLALTWAAHLLASPSEEAAHLVEAWDRADLRGLHEPGYQQRTPPWLFDRSIRHLDADATHLLQVFGLLAHAPVALDMASAGFAGPAADAATTKRVRAALQRLVQTSLLGVQWEPGAAWQFNHVLGHGAARGTVRALPASEIGQHLVRYLAERLLATVDVANTADDQGQLVLLLQHSGALLEIAGVVTGKGLLTTLLYEVTDRLLAQGQLSIARSALDAAGQAFATGHAYTPIMV